MNVRRNSQDGEDRSGNNLFIYIFKNPVILHNQFKTSINLYNVYPQLMHGNISYYSLLIKKILFKKLQQINSFLIGSSFNAFILFAYHQPKHLRQIIYIV